MRKETRFLLVLAFLFLLFAEGLSWVTASWPGECIVSPEQNDAASNQANQKNCPTFHVGMWILVKRADGVIGRHDKSIVAVFTIVLAISTIGLWRSTRALWHSTEATGERQIRDTEILQRAYVSVEPDGIEPHQDRSDRVHGRVIFRNVGHLSARNVKWYGTCGMPKDHEVFPIEELFSGQLVLPPGAAARQRIGTAFTQGHGKEIPMPRIGNSTFVWGIVTYEDGFGKRRFTRFCHRYPTKAFIGRDAFILGPEMAELHDHGNDAD
jgi:hypothetical protein